MYKKTCSFCNKNSYSAALGDWQCPYCQADLSEVLSEPAGRVGDEINKQPDKVKAGEFVMWPGMVRLWKCYY